MVIKNICAFQDCTGCAACSQICPKHAIEMVANEEGFLYPRIAEEKCIECGLCQKKCPMLCQTEKSSATFFMGWHKEEAVLKTSSSGGVFTALADYVFRRNGVVFGAAKTADGEVVHQIARNAGELAPLKMSKYSQSKIGNTYQSVKEHLTVGYPVLFTGTACQIAGLKAYLGGANRDNLITMDVLCHGIASKTVVDSFIQSKERQFQKKIADYSFRVKEEKRGWYNGGGNRMQLFFSDGTSVVEPGDYDTFFLGFNHNYFLRESCYRCRFCGTDRVSDFTVADYWKCNHQEISRQQLLLGVSLILANTDKAKRMLPELRDDLEIIEIDGTDAVQHNRALSKPQDRPALRDDFYALMRKDGYDKTVKKQFRNRFLKRRIKKILWAVLPEKIAVKIIKTL